jgi:hypothetical protein
LQTLTGKTALLTFLWHVKKDVGCKELTRVHPLRILARPLGQRFILLIGTGG